MRRVVPVVMGLLIAAAVLPLLPAGPAGAAAGPPGNVAPTNGSEPTTNPVFRWTPGAGALRYLLEISLEDDLSPVIAGGSIATTNVQATYPTELANNVTYYWRVTAYDTATGTGGAAVGPTWSFTKRAIAAPGSLSPSGTGANPTVLAYPFNTPNATPTFTWAPVAGAKEYEFFIDDDENFTGAPAAKKTANAAYTLTAPVAMDQTFFWKVRAITTSNEPSVDSEVKAFRFHWGAPPQDTTPTPISPPNTNSPPIEDVVFEWTAIPGAPKYDVQWSLSDQFTNPTTVRTTATRYSPPTTILNQSYWWHVRGVGADDSPGTWSTPSRFTRAWPATQSAPEQLGSIKLLTPPNGVVIPTDEPAFSWTPQRLGSRYQVEVSPDINFSPALTDTCQTNHTQLTPKSGCGVDPDPNVVQYWRVKALDEPATVNGAYSETFSFLYYPQLVTQTGPPNGTSTSTPILTWDTASSPLIARYRVSIYNKGGTLVRTADTYSDSLTAPLPGGTHFSAYAPSGLSTLPADNPHTWKVQTIDIANRVGPMPGTSRSFTVTDPAGAVATPQPTSQNNAVGSRVPPLSWQPVTGAVRYNVDIAVVGTNLFVDLVNNWEGLAYVHNTSSVAPGNYEWRVEAEDQAGNVIATTLPSGSPSRLPRFSVIDLEQSTPVSPLHCPSQQGCAAEYDTPTLDWQPVLGATHYKVYIATDELFTTIVGGTPYDTQFSTLTPQISLPDNVGDQAYFWYARPCFSRSPERCGPQPSTFAGQVGSPVRAFRKLSNPVGLLKPANGATIGLPVGNPGDANYTPGTQVTFSWNGFLQTNCTLAPTVGSSLPPYCVPPDPTVPRAAGSIPVVTQEARKYRIEVSAESDFTPLLDSADVDQTTYTASTKLYPEGPVYWRVAPVDASNNRLPWSEVRMITKASPPVSLRLPTAGASVSVPTLAVNPQPFEAQWEFEIYKNLGQPSLSTSNRVFNLRTNIPAATPTTALPPLPNNEEYGWRVRRWDVNNQAGEWSAGNSAGLRRFTVTGVTVSLIAPASGATIPTDRVFYEWSPVPRATRYKLEVNTSQAFTGSVPEAAVTTVGANWAPRITYAEGTYWWKVSALDSAGNVLGVSQPRSFNTGEQGSRYVPLAPIRVVDSREGTGWSGRLAVNSPRTLKVAGSGLSAPEGASAVVLNVTAVESSQESFMAVYPNGSDIPNPGSMLNFTAGQIIPNLVTVKVGTNGSIKFATNQGQVHVVADLVGYYHPNDGDRYNSLTPFRLLDSRDSNTTAYWNPSGALGQDQSRTLQVRGRGGVPASATAAIVNITAVEGSRSSYLTAYPSGGSRPEKASNLNFSAGQVIPNLAIVKIGTDGRIALYNNLGSVNVVVDVVGYFQPSGGSYFHPLAPSRVLDTRFNNGLSGRFTPGITRNLQVSGRGGVPAGATAVVMNTTAVVSTLQGYLMVFPGDAQKPENASNLNFVAGQIIPNMVTVGLSTTTSTGNPIGTVNIYNNVGSVDVLGDVMGYSASF